MEFSELFGVVEILKESIKLLPKNGKLMALLTMLCVVLSSILLSISNFSTKSVLRDMLVNESSLPVSSSNTSVYTNVLASIKKDMALFFIICVVFLLAFFTISFFSTISTILVSAASYSDKTISIKDLVLRVLKSWTRPLITELYITLLAVGYFWFVIFMVSPLLINHDTWMLYVAILIGMVAYVFYIYLAVVWFLAIFISVIEEDCFGIEALGKAGRIVKGKRLQGFVLNVLFGLIAMITYQGFRIMRGHQWVVNPSVVAFFTATLSCFLKTFEIVVFTVFYFHCQKNHGEEVELHGSFDSVVYSKISAMPFVDDVSEKV